MLNISETVVLLKTAPPSQLDPSMVALVNQWGEPPTSLQILEVLDRVIYGALASDLVVDALNILYEVALENEGKTHDEVVPLAIWRDALISQAFPDDDA